MSNEKRIQRIKDRHDAWGGSPEGMAKATGLNLVDCRRMWAEDLAKIDAVIAGPAAEESHNAELGAKDHARMARIVRRATRNGGEIF